MSSSAFAGAVDFSWSYVRFNNLGVLEEEVCCNCGCEEVAS